jgi:hypothetical protein
MAFLLLCHDLLEFDVQLKITVELITCLIGWTWEMARTLITVGSGAFDSCVCEFTVGSGDLDSNSMHVNSLWGLEPSIPMCVNSLWGLEPSIPMRVNSLWGLEPTTPTVCV